MNRDADNSFSGPFLTTVIPVSSISSHRRRNLDFVCARLNDAFGDENRTVIVFKGEVRYSNELAEVVDFSEDLQISSQFVMFLGPDVFFDFKEIKKKVVPCDKIVMPFSELSNLDEHLTRNLIEKRSASIHSGIKVTNVPIGSGALVVRSDLVGSGIMSDHIRFGEDSDDWWIIQDGGVKFKTGHKFLGCKAVLLHRDPPISRRKASRGKIVHAFNYACVNESSRLHKEQSRALDSYLSNAKDKGVVLVNFHSGDCLKRESVVSAELGRTAKSIGHAKDFAFLNDIFNMAMPYVDGDGWIFYCNSDCLISDSVYDDILGFEGDYMEFQRQEVDSAGNHLGSVRRGIDGIAIRKSLLQSHKMPELLIGAPYWDDAVSTLYSSVCKRRLRVMNQLIHTEHDPTYDLSNLDVAGELNFKAFSKVFSDAMCDSLSWSDSPVRCQILIKVSTLGRPEMLFECLDSFVENMSGNNLIFFCITCNRDDESMTDEVVGKLKSRYKNIKVFFGDHKSKIDAYNADLENFDFDVLVAASDDMVAVEKDYDQVILDCMNQHFPDTDGVVWFETCDGNQRTDTLSVMGRRYFERFGKVYNSEYLGYYCDDEFTQVAFKLGKLKRIDYSIICHNIPDHLKMSDDSTYLKSLVYGMRDKALYKIRKGVQFDIPGADSNIDSYFSDVFFQDKRNKHERPYWLTPHPKFDDPITPMEVYVLENMDRKVAEMDIEHFLSFAGNYFRDFRWTIPPIIHQIWFGEVPSRIKEMMETFSEDYVSKNPGTRYILWNERRLRSLGMINKDVFELETKHDCKSDIARLEILNKFGGFYVDSDCVWLGTKTLNSVPSKNGIMIAYEKAGTSIGRGYLEKETTRCANGVFGSTVANPIIAFMIGRLKDAYASQRRYGVVASTGPDFVQGVLDSLNGLTETVSHKHFYPIWWCVNKDKNPEYEEFLRQRDLSVKSLALLHPESVLFHKGFTSAEGAKH